MVQFVEPDLSDGVPILLSLSGTITIRQLGDPRQIAVDGNIIVQEVGESNIYVLGGRTTVERTRREPLEQLSISGPGAVTLKTPVKGINIDRRYSFQAA